MSAFLASTLGKWTGIMVAVLAGAFAQTMMKYGTQRVGIFGETPFLEYLVRLLTCPFILLAVASYGVGVVSYMFMLSRLDLSFLYPIMVALGLALATLVSAWIFHERIAIVRLTGILVVMVGVFLVAQS